MEKEHSFAPVPHPKIRLEAQRDAYAAYCAAKGYKHWDKIARFPLEIPINPNDLAYTEYLIFLRECSHDRKNNPVARYLKALEKGKQLEKNWKIWVLTILVRFFGHGIFWKRLGSGVFGSVALVKGEALKIYWEMESGVFLRDVFALHLGTGEPFLPEMIAISKKLHVVLMTEIKGIPLRKIPRAQIDAIPVPHWDSFLEILCTMNNRGVFLDPNIKNILYHPDFGFSVVDPDLFQRGAISPSEVLESISQQIRTRAFFKS